MKQRLKLLIFSIFCAFVTYGQNVRPAYKRELKGISGNWHRIELPDGIFYHTQDNLSDLRVIGVTQAKDTIEAPYLLKIAGYTDSALSKSFKIINQSYNGKTFFATFEMPQEEEINQISLDFSQTNFDWNVKLEGSNTASEWFSVTDKYRIVAISNEMTSFKFTTLKFGTSKYKYFRITIDSPVKPDLNEVFLSKIVTAQMSSKRFLVKKITVLENKVHKSTDLEIDLGGKVPIHMIKLKIASAFDYFRPVNIEYLVDSFKTEKGWRYNYAPLSSDVLNSKSNNLLKFKTVFTKKIRLQILNEDNQALKISDVEVFGNTYQMIVRFTEKADYFLHYGGETAASPNYDISHFQAQLPADIPSLQVGNEIEILPMNKKLAKPLISNSWWLWAIMGIVIIVLGGFTIKMMKEV